MKKLIILIFIMSSILCMEKPAPQQKKTEANTPAYSNEDRESIISMIASLKQGHLLFPIADSVFQVSIKHALLDGKELLPQEGNFNIDTAVTVALANLARTIRQTCPKKDFLDSVEMILEQIDDRYQEEAKPLLAKPDVFNKEVMIQLAYAIAHYKQFNQKNLKYMVHLHKRAPEILQEKLQAIPQDTIQKWHTEFMKDEQAS